MTGWPPPYPRMPHLWRTSSATRDDLVLSEADRRRLLSGPVVVEEKLDGANVMLWMARGGGVQAATRGGPDALDRGGQLGPLRAWIGPRSDELRSLLEGGAVLYAEWLWRRHTVHYGRLSDWLFGIDLLDKFGQWLDTDDRDDALATAGVMRPPRLAERGLVQPEHLAAMAATSRLGDEPAEGIVIRRGPGSAGGARLAKLVVSEFRRSKNEDFAEQRREGNRLARGEGPITSRLRRL